MGIPPCRELPVYSFTAGGRKRRVEGRLETFKIVKFVRSFPEAVFSFSVISSAVLLPYMVYIGAEYVLITPQI